MEWTSTVSSPSPDWKIFITQWVWNTSCHLVQDLCTRYLSACLSPWVLMSQHSFQNADLLSNLSHTLTMESFYLKTETTVWIKTTCFLFNYLENLDLKSLLICYSWASEVAYWVKALVSKADDQVWPLKPAYPLGKCPLLVPGTFLYCLFCFCQYLPPFFIAPRT